MKAIKVLSKKCVGCEICGIVCSMVHGDQTRESAMRIRIKHCYPDMPTPPFQPRVCRNCKKPRCVNVCPNMAIVVDQETEQVRLIDSKCDGCGQCVEACPFHAIWVDPISKVAIKCDLCHGDPQCVKFCNFSAIQFST
jgi:anaerobic carbon-monoxide dehydrogenase iron sulfur subunit